jgi:hypothetical protein
MTVQLLEFIIGQFRTHSIASHVHELTEEMGAHIEAVTDALTTFIDVGVLVCFSFLCTPIDALR